MHPAPHSCNTPAAPQPLALTPARPPQGSWNLRDVRFPGGSTIRSWAFTTLVDPRYLVADGPTGTDTFLDDLVSMCNKTGLACATPVKVRRRGCGGRATHRPALPCVLPCCCCAAGGLSGAWRRLAAPRTSPAADALARACCGAPALALARPPPGCAPPAAAAQGPYDPRDTIEQRIRKAAAAAAQQFGSP